jgi:hypothetical protein
MPNVIMADQKGRYTLLASGSYTWAGGSTNLTVPVSYSGKAKMYGVNVNEPLANMAQTFCACVLIDDDIFPNVFRNPPDKAGFAYAFGRRSDNSFSAQSYTYANTGLNSERMALPNPSGSYPWRPNTYNWYIWGVSE